MHKEEEALITLKMYGMDCVPKEEPIEKLPSSLDEIDSFINKATAEEHDVQKKVAKRLRQENEPYNSVYACEIDEVSPQRGEVNRIRDHSSIAASAGGT